MLILFLFLQLMIRLIHSMQCIKNDIFDNMSIISPNTNDTITTTNIDVTFTYSIKDAQLFYANENQLMLCITTKHIPSNNMKSVCGLSLTYTHSLSLYYHGYQDIIATVCYKNSTNSCICSASVTVYNDYGPSCLKTTKINTMFDIIRANTIELQEIYRNAYNALESDTIVDVFIPIHYHVVDSIISNELSLSLAQSQIIAIQSVISSINDVSSKVNVNMHFLLYNFNVDSNKKKIDDILAWLLTLTDQKLPLKLYLCPSNPNEVDCSFWTIYENVNNLNNDSIIIVFDSNNHIVQRSFIKSIYNLFSNNNPCYSLSSWSPPMYESIPPLYYIDTSINKQYIRWGYVQDQLTKLSLNNSTLAFRLSTFSYFIKHMQAVTNFEDHLVNLKNSNYGTISIVYY